MSLDEALINESFPRSNKYNPEWLVAAASSAANPLWLTEWLTADMHLRPGMRVLDLGCGRAASSVFLHREFGVEVWAVDLWFSASENFRRIGDAEVERQVFPIHADAHALPFAPEFFDAIASIDSFPYFGTDDLYLSYLARFLRPGGYLGIAGAGLTREFEGAIPEHLRNWWTPDLCCLHSADWWRRQWDRSGTVDLQFADSMQGGWALWLDWLSLVAPENQVEIDAIEADRGANLTYVRVLARRKENINLDDPLVSVPTQYTRKRLLRDDVSDTRLKLDEAPWSD
ncbi:MAG: class I SAM-dependent methyltransferase [Acidobacteriaceae bacterium]|nr:class I SAM-dependent methyltransferase [Acidobacteriaceae bacterium]